MNREWDKENVDISGGVEKDHCSVQRNKEGPLPCVREMGFASETTIDSRLSMGRIQVVEQPPSGFASHEWRDQDQFAS